MATLSCSRFPVFFARWADSCTSVRGFPRPTPSARGWTACLDRSMPAPRLTNSKILKPRGFGPQVPWNPRLPLGCNWTAFLRRFTLWFCALRSGHLIKSQLSPREIKTHVWFVRLTVLEIFVSAAGLFQKSRAVKGSQIDVWCGHGRCVAAAFLFPQSPPRFGGIP